MFSQPFFWGWGRGAYFNMMTVFFLFANKVIVSVVKTSKTIVIVKTMGS